MIDPSKQLLSFSHVSFFLPYDDLPPLILADN